MTKFIPVAEPSLGEEETQAVLDVMKGGFISGTCGEYIKKFENEFAAYCGSRFGISTTNGTTALHLALVAAGIKPGDEVITSNLTNIATLLAITYCGATPVLVECEPDTWNMNTSKVSEKLTSKTKAILPVHIYGHPCNMDPLLDLARDKSLLIIEDDAEAHGAEFKGKRLPVGDVGCFSFYSNKIITTGEGGMIVTNNEEIAAAAQDLKNLAYGKQERFSHERIGFNYRLTNLQAAIGCAQLKKIDSFIEKKRQIASWYNARLQDTFTLPVEKDYAKNIYWMYGVLVKEGVDRQQLMRSLIEKGIQTRDFFKPMHEQPVFLNKGLFQGESYPISSDLYKRGLYIPSGVGLTEEDIDFISTTIKQVLQQ